MRASLCPCGDCERRTDQPDRGWPVNRNWSCFCPSSWTFLSGPIPARLVL